MEQKIKILHLEDAHSDAELIKMELINANIKFESLLVDTKEEFIQGLKSFSPDIILADHSVPSFNSREALKIVKENNANIPFLLVTTSISEDVVKIILGEGANGYILKDQLSHLPEAIKNAFYKKETTASENDTINKNTIPEKLYDLSLLEEMDDNDYLSEIISIFLDETPKELNEMIKALKSKKAAVVANKAHKLKSSAGLIEAQTLLQLLEKIEEMAKAERMTAELDKHVENAEAEYKKIEVSLQKHLKAIQQYTSH